MAFRGELDRKWIKCYCGWHLFILSAHKVTNLFDQREYEYKKPRWQLVNCYPKKGGE